MANDRGRGRPPVGPPIQIRLDPNLLAWIDRKAESEGITRAQMIRGILLVAALDDAHSPDAGGLRA